MLTTLMYYICVHVKQNKHKKLYTMRNVEPLLFKCLEKNSANLLLCDSTQMLLFSMNRIAPFLFLHEERAYFQMNPLTLTSTLTSTHATTNEQQLNRAQHRCTEYVPILMCVRMNSMLNFKHVICSCSME